MKRRCVCYAVNLQTDLLQRKDDSCEIQNKACDYIAFYHFTAPFAYERYVFAGGQPYRRCRITVWDFR